MSSEKSTKKAFDYAEMQPDVAAKENEPISILGAEQNPETKQDEEEKDKVLDLDNLIVAVEQMENEPEQPVMIETPAFKSNAAPIKINYESLNKDDKNESPTSVQSQKDENNKGEQNGEQEQQQTEDNQLNSSGNQPQANQGEQNRVSDLSMTKIDP